jgi:hypothetical protein
MEAKKALVYSVRDATAPGDQRDHCKRDRSQPETHHSRRGAGTTSRAGPTRLATDSSRSTDVSRHPTMPATSCGSTKAGNSLRLLLAPPAQLTMALPELQRGLQRSQDFLPARHQQSSRRDWPQHVVGHGVANTKCGVYP